LLSAEVDPEEIFMKIRQEHSLQWITESFEEDESFLQRRMFGGLAIYHDGLLKLVLFDKEEPWNGVLVCTSREYHESLQREFPELVSHEVLGKWLYLSQSEPRFEAIVARLTALLLARDKRVGIEKAKRKKKVPRKRLLKPRPTA
jgi:hypothetical protein